MEEGREGQNPVQNSMWSGFEKVLPVNPNRLIIHRTRERSDERQRAEMLWETILKIHLYRTLSQLDIQEEEDDQKHNLFCSGIRKSKPKWGSEGTIKL